MTAIWHCQIEEKGEGEERGGVEGHTAKRPVGSAGNDDGSDSVFGVEVCESGDHFLYHGLRERIAFGRPVEDDQGNACRRVECNLEVLQSIHVRKLGPDRANSWKCFSVRCNACR